MSGGWNDVALIFQSFLRTRVGCFLQVLSRQGEEAMKRSKNTEEQMLFGLWQAEAGQPAADICRQMGISEATSCLEEAFREPGSFRGSRAATAA